MWDERQSSSRQCCVIARASGVRVRGILSIGAEFRSCEESSMHRSLGQRDWILSVFPMILSSSARNGVCHHRCRMNSQIEMYMIERNFRTVLSNDPKLSFLNVTHISRWSMSDTIYTEMFKLARCRLHALLVFTKDPMAMSDVVTWSLPSQNSSTIKLQIEGI